MRKLLIIFLGVSLLAVAVVAAALWKHTQVLEQSLQLEGEQLLNVPAGSTPNALLAQLEQRGVMKGALWLRLGWRLQGQVQPLRTGEYELAPNMTVAQLLEKWRIGDVVQHRITLVEGWSFRQVRQALAQQEKLEQSIGELSNSELMRTLGLANVHPEGRFFPDTYQYVRGQSDLDILHQASERLQKVLAEEWAGRAEGLPYKSPDEALIMASIIEKETGVAHEREEIAGVFVRRLNIGMLLQTDPTVIYGMGERYSGKITRADLRRPTPYNTYVISGLPPTPIAMVGREAIHAALHPKPGKSLYFVARGDGSHVFSNTLREHNQAVREYQLKRRSDYRSSPAPVSKD
ncbi:endolytic transglycosylase MltG [Denitrificimonas sp. JX-1]|uniref:Endolytic murein transglycosylase n=1 Tax=Denitrificimonas halotolerans TaxID=3098930 RepID=A0ABU5GNV4_9GAMM|nr:endolytic transglycosylase MltG [Denitrificimonas sp. JX-1]MDY7218177.1 endolytic transglycosylase MltG [Denitrificimonas sp. JX-1]